MKKLFIFLFLFIISGFSVQGFWDFEKPPPFIMPKYLGGQPIDGYLGSGILYSSSNLPICGCINVTHDGENVTYHDLLVRIRDIGSTTYCELENGTQPAVHESHSVFYTDSTCTIKNMTWLNWFDQPIIPSGYKRLWDVFMPNGDIEVLKGASLKHLADRKNAWLNVNCGGSHLSICNGIDIVEDIFPAINQTNGHYRYLDTEVPSDEKSSIINGMHIVSHVGGIWTHLNQSQINLTHCNDGTNHILCQNNKHRPYVIYSINWGDKTIIHQLAPSDSVFFNNLADCVDYASTELEYTIPPNEQGVAVVYKVLCSLRDETDWANVEWIDIRTGVSGGGATFDLSPYMTYAEWSMNANANDKNLTSVDTMTSKNIINTDGDIVVVDGFVQAQASGGTPYVFTMDGAHANGPRLQLGLTTDLDQYFEIGAYGNINNFDSKNRDLRLYTDAGGAYIYIDSDSEAIGIMTLTPNAELDVNGEINAHTLDTGHGPNELYDMDQHVKTTSAVTFATIDTGQGANELYDMDQNVKTDSNVDFYDIDVPTFGSVDVTGSLTNYNLGQDVSQIAQSPVPKYLWHDLYAFSAKGVPTFSVSNDLVTWTEKTIDKRLFIQKENQAIEVMNSTGNGSRWEWYKSGICWSSGKWLAIGYTWLSGAPTRRLVFETSEDGGNWTTRHNSTANTVAQPIWHYISDYGGDDYHRLTITRESGENNIKLSAIKLLSARWGDQGIGSEYEYPYAWNEDRDIGIHGDLYGTSGSLTVDDYLDVTSGISATTLNTGQGENDLYDMNQNVMTTSDVTFDHIETNTLNSTNLILASSNTNPGLQVGDGTTGYLKLGDSVLKKVAGQNWVISGFEPDNDASRTMGASTKRWSIIYALEVRTKNANFTINTNDVDRMIISPDGNVGINITNPTSLLHVGGDANITGTLSAKNIETGNITISENNKITMGNIATNPDYHIMSNGVGQLRMVNNGTGDGSQNYLNIDLGQNWKYGVTLSAGGAGGNLLRYSSDTMVQDGKRLLLSSTSSSGILGKSTGGIGNYVVTFYASGTTYQSQYFYFDVNQNRYPTSSVLDPTVRIWSGETGAGGNDKWIQFFHNQTDGYIETGEGDLVLNPDSNVAINGSLEVLTLTGIGNAYACINENGTIYRSNVTCI